MECESTGDPNAYNRFSATTGLMQVHPDNLYGIPHEALAGLAETHPEFSYRDWIAWLKVPANNLDAAYRIWKFSGWGEWTCQP